MIENEASARILINKKLEEAGWRLSNSSKGKKNVDLEYSIKKPQFLSEGVPENSELSFIGRPDYVLLDKKGFPLVILEAKAGDKNPFIGKERARQYAKALNCRFVILSNGTDHYFWDLEHGNPNPIKKFPSQEFFESRINEFKPAVKKIWEEIIESDYIVMTQLPYYKSNPYWQDEKTRSLFFESNKNLKFLRLFQIRAIRALQDAAKKGNDRFLFEMATGTGKTLVSAAVIKLFLRTGNARRVLFIVDRLELEGQAYRSFVNYLSMDYKSLIYKDDPNGWNKAEIVISTIQTLLSKNRYKRIFNPYDFDFVISDEAHRSIGGNSRTVFEYFYGYKLGLTATPKDYLKNIDTDFLSINDPREFERRTLLDTYKTFGCDSGIPTFCYSLIDGINDPDGPFLINPFVIDARTEITTQLLSKDGFLVKKKYGEEKDEDEVYIQTDFERKFFSTETNKVFCKVFMDNARCDPISGEIGKTIIFCVSQDHASKITQILNELAHEKFPNKYHSDFAVQVTSWINDAQSLSRNFANNNLSGSGNFRSDYKTGKTRVCVTVSMMTTGYDCQDILNIVLMRPIFSPTEFIQIKGRGTRKYDFSQDLINPELRRSIGSKQKEKYNIFDFFANFHYFEHEFNYDGIINLPPKKEGISYIMSPDHSLSVPNGYIYTGHDYLNSTSEIMIGLEGMKIDRKYFEKFEKKVKSDSFITQQFNKGEWKALLDYIDLNIMNKPEEYFNLEDLRKAISLDRKISTRELIEKIFGLIPYIKYREELLNDEFDKFDNRFLPDEKIFDDTKTVFLNYIIDREFREIIDSKKFARLNLQPVGIAFKNLPSEMRKIIPRYVKDNIPLDKFFV